MKKILNICVNYKNNSEIIEYLKNIIKNNSKNLKSIDIVIVDNSCEDFEYNELQEKTIEFKSCLNIFVFRAPENLGYLNGLLYGLYKYKENMELPEWIVFSNTDIDFLTQEFFDEFLKKEYNENTYMIGPSIYSTSGKNYQNPQYMNRLTLKHLNRIINFNKLGILKLAYQLLFSFKNKITNKKEKKSSMVYSVHGSFIFLRKNLFTEENIKYFSFLYGEEIFLAEIILKKNKKVFYDNSLRLLHDEHSTTSKIEASKKRKLFIQSIEKIKNFFY